MTPKNKTAVIYLYCDRHARSQQNFENFAATGLVNNVDFFVVGSEINLSKVNYKRSSFKEIYVDDGEHEHQKFSRVYRDHVKNSDYQSVVVVSSGMSGPYSMPDGDQNWVKRFTEQLTRETHLVGSSIVMMPSDHPLTKLQNENKVVIGVVPYVPTSAFALSREALDFLETECFFDQEIPPCELSLQLLYEMRMSELLLENGWNITCLLSKYSDINFRSVKKDPNPTSWYGDPRRANSYFGGNIDKQESVFIETSVFETGCSTSNFERPENIKLFGIFYDEKSRSAITSDFIPLDNSKGPKYLYESYPILRQLERTPPENDTWLGFFSPKFSEKTGITANDIYGEVECADKDVSVVLFSSHWKQVALWPNIWLQGETFHPGLGDITRKLIELAGYNIDITKTYSTLSDGVFSNYLVAKNEFWVEWRRLVSIYYQLITQNDRLLKHATAYHGNATPIHTFVIERVASLIILELGLKTKFSQSLYNRNPNSTPIDASLDGFEAIKMNRCKTKFNETSKEAYRSIYSFHLRKINERNKRDLAKRMLLNQAANRVA